MNVSPASTLYEAAALAISEFRRCGFTTNAPGPATRLAVIWIGVHFGSRGFGHKIATRFLNRAGAKACWAPLYPGYFALEGTFERSGHVGAFVLRWGT